MLDTIYLVAAVIGGTILVCQFLLTLLGMGDDSDVADAGADADIGSDFDGDFDAAGEHHTSITTAADAEYQHTDSSWLFGVLSFRTLIAAAAFFGIAGRAASSAGMSPSSSLVVATLIGLSAMYGMYWLMQGISKLTSSGNLRIGNSVGCKARVYVPIPAGHQGAGKVQLSMQNRVVEYQAVTEDADGLKTGEEVVVVGVAGSDLVRVRRAVETAAT